MDLHCIPLLNPRSILCLVVSKTASLFSLALCERNRHFCVLSRSLNVIASVRTRLFYCVRPRLLIQRSEQKGKVLGKCHRLHVRGQQGTASRMSLKDPQRDWAHCRSAHCSLAYPVLLFIPSPSSFSLFLVIHRITGTAIHSVYTQSKLLQSLLWELPLGPLFLLRHDYLMKETLPGSYFHAVFCIMPRL